VWLEQLQKLKQKVLEVIYFKLFMKMYCVKLTSFFLSFYLLSFSFTDFPLKGGPSLAWPSSQSALLGLATGFG